MTARFLSLSEFAARVGVTPDALKGKGYTLPTPDVLVGTTRGWTVETVDQWNAARPGRGRWGNRPPSTNRVAQILGPALGVDVIEKEND